MKTEEREGNEGMTAEQAWTKLAKRLAILMAQGGVKEFRVAMNERGNFDYEVVPGMQKNK